MIAALHAAGCSALVGVSLFGIGFALRCLMRDATKRAEDLSAGRHPEDLP